MAFAGTIGCRPPDMISAEATAWESLAKDPAETGNDLDRWPGWRGVNGAGIAPGAKPAIEFGPQKGVRWTAEIPGEGNSSPVIWGSRVVLTTVLDSTSPATLAVLCLDRTTGALLWKAEVGRTRGHTHAKNGYASATAVTDGSRIIAGFGSAGLFCFDNAGKQLWHTELGNLDQIWGSAASPMLYRDLVIQLCDSEHDSYLGAFQVETGRPVWKTPRASKACWTTPVLVTAKTPRGPRTELIVNGTGAGEDGTGCVIAYHPDDGRELWRVHGTTGLVTPTALVAGGLVFSLSGRNGPIMAMRPGGSGDVTGSQVLWRLSRNGPYIPSGVVYRNRLYLVSDNGMIVCINPGNSREIWRHRLWGTFTASLIAADGRIYAVNEQGAIFVIAAADSFELLATNKLAERCYATPAPANGDLLVRTQHRLYCFQGIGD